MSNRQARAERRAAERRSAREQIVERFGAAADERVADRRQRRSPAEVERILRQLGVEDRRRGDRRRR